jgi:hypothetical protein
MLSSSPPPVYPHGGDTEVMKGAGTTYVKLRAVQLPVGVVTTTGT